MPDPLKSSQQNLHSWRSRRPLIWVCSRRLLTWCHSHLLFFPRGGRWLRRGAFPAFHPSVKKLLVSKRSYVFPEALQKSLIWSKICKLNKISKHQLCIIFIYLLYFKPVRFIFEQIYQRLIPCATPCSTSTYPLGAVDVRLFICPSY